MPGRIGFEFQFSRPRESGHRRDEDSPMRILVMGDFSGRGSRGVRSAGDLASRPVVSVDVDNFEQVLVRLAPALRLSPADPAGIDATIDFRKLDDFHPDHLYRELELFRPLRETRARLRDPKTFAEAAGQIRGSLQAASSPASPAGADSGAPAAESDGTTLERLLGSKPAARDAPAAARHTGPAGLADELIRKAVAPYIVPDAPPQQAQYVASVDAAIGEQMRAILHHPSYQALEAAWLGVHWLISELEIGEELKLYLLDVTRDELRDDLAACAEQPERSGLYRRLVSQGADVPGSEPWSLLAGAYEFGPGPEDLQLLAFLGAVASQAGGPFLAGAHASILGCDALHANPDHREWRPLEPETEAQWQVLRKSGIASWIGLALPKVLMRAPYGKPNYPVEQFDFVEQRPAPAHEDYLWGNPALACALLLARGFLANGWSMEPGDERDIGGLPTCVVERNGERELLPVAEAYLSERAGEAILARGVMPLMSLKNQNAARLMRFQSLADPAKPLSGAWR